MISSACSAASCFSILAIRGMLEPSSRSRVRHRLQVGGGGDEGDGQQVDAVLDRELDPVEVDAGRRRQVDAAGDVHPLVRGEGSPHLDLAVDALGLGIVDPQPDRAVGQVDELVVLEVGDPRPGDRDRLGVALELARGQGHVHPRLQFGEVVAQRADPQLRPRQVAQHRHLAPDPLGGAADIGDRLRLAVRRGVGEVEAEDVGAGCDQLLDRRGLPARRPDRGDDLRPPLDVNSGPRSRIRLHPLTVGDHPETRACGAVRRAWEFPGGLQGRANLVRGRVADRDEGRTDCNIDRCNVFPVTPTATDSASPTAPATGWSDRRRPPRRGRSSRPSSAGSPPRPRSRSRA